MIPLKLLLHMNQSMQNVWAGNYFWTTLLDSQFGFKKAHGTCRNGHNCTQVIRGFLRNQHTFVYVLHWCRKDIKNVNHWTLAKKQLDIKIPLHNVRWVKSLWYGVVTRYQGHSDVRMGSNKRDSCHHRCILYIYIYRHLNYHFQATDVGCYVGGAWVN